MSKTICTETWQQRDEHVREFSRKGSPEDVHPWAKNLALRPPPRSRTVKLIKRNGKVVA